MEQELPKSYDKVRTMSIVKQLLQGKRLTLPDGSVIGMREDMAIGFMYSKFIEGKEVYFISDLSTMGLDGLNKILTKNKIGISI